MAATETKLPIILFDGVCNLCNASVQFIVRNDKHSKFRFASLQSGAGRNLIRQFKLREDKLYSIILVLNNSCFDKSGAALEIAKRLDGLWPLMYLFILVPSFIRDFVYDWISRNRYKWFGQRNECMIPTAELKSRFLG